MRRLQIDTCTLYNKGVLMQQHTLSACPDYLPATGACCGSVLLSSPLLWLIAAALLVPHSCC